MLSFKEYNGDLHLYPTSGEGELMTTFLPALLAFPASLIFHPGNIVRLNMNMRF